MTKPLTDGLCDGKLGDEFQTAGLNGVELDDLLESGGGVTNAHGVARAQGKFIKQASVAYK